MKNSNQRTLETYHHHAQAYVSGTRHLMSGEVQDWIADAVEGLAPTARLMEVGSGPGVDALHFQSLGYEIACTDAAPAFVERLRALGRPAQLFNALTDLPSPGFDLIFANAVLLHFTRDEFAGVLERFSNALAPGGRLAFSLKRGDGEAWSDEKLNAPRYFCYWQAQALPDLLAAAGFSTWSIKTVSYELSPTDWIYVVARKA